jgi:hypothetical protein
MSDETQQAESFYLPPASFDEVTFFLLSQAQGHLGLMHFGPPEEKPQPNFEAARHWIDLLAVLQEKTRGNLTMAEQRTLENSLTELRFRYVQVMEDSKKEKPAKAEGQSS